MKRFPHIEFGELGAPIGRLTFVERAAFPAVPPAVRLYKVQPHASRKAAFVGLVKALSIAGSPDVEAKIQRLERAPEPALAKDRRLGGDIGGWNISVYAGGQFSLFNRTVHLTGTDAQAPSPQEARQAADAFLSRTGLMPSSARFTNVVAGQTDIRGGGDQPGDVLVQSRIVYYDGQLDGIPTYGPLGIEVGPGGAVVRLSNRFRRTVPDQLVPILSPEESLAKLRAGEGHFADGPAWRATGYVDSIKLVYWQPILAQDLSYIMPVYVFEGEAVAEGRKPEPWRAYVEAVRPEFLEGSDLERPLHPEPTTAAPPEPKKPPITIRPGDPETRPGR